MDATAELESLISAAKQNGWQEARDLLTFVRREKLRLPQLVLEYGAILLSKKDKLGDELWTVYEQVFLAALDEFDIATADVCLDALASRFQKSTRVSRLVAMRSEALGDFEAAEKGYKVALVQNPATFLVVKRQVACLVAQGKTSAAISTLSNHLDVSGGDADGWKELARLHILLGNFLEASFCYEELVLLSPTEPHYHCRLAELYYSMGGWDGLIKARKHFSQSLELKKTNPRALYGLCTTCAALATDKSCAKGLKAEQNGQVNSQLHSFATEELGKLYANQPKPIKEAVVAVCTEQATWIRSPTVS